LVDWAEKYRPRSLKEIVGNPTAVKELRTWADSWEHRPAKKAVVLSGDAGVGKTSAALALARDMGWIPVEMNASDARTAERLAALAEVMTMGVKAGVEPLALWAAIRQGAFGRRRSFDRLAMAGNDRASHMVDQSVERVGPLERESVPEGRRSRFLDEVAP